MNAFSKINDVRRRIMRSLTGGIGSSHTVPKIDLSRPVEIKRVLINRPNNRLGNLLLITPLVQEVAETFPGVKIDLFVRGGLAPVLFKNYPNVDRIIQLPKKPFEHLIDYFATWIKIKSKKYDLVINVVKNSSSGRLSTKFATSRFKIFGDIDETIQTAYSDYKHVAKYPVYNLRKYLGYLGFRDNKRPAPLMDIKLSIDELAKGHKLLEGLTQNNKPTISLFTYATGSKCYSPEWWEPFYERLQSEFPGYNFIEVLPVENVSQLGFRLPSFYSKDVREIGAVIANTNIFIGADSGIMHLGSAVKTPTVGLFHVTEKTTFGPYGNNSIAVNTNETNIDEIINQIRSVLTKCTTASGVEGRKAAYCS